MLVRCVVMAMSVVDAGVLRMRDQFCGLSLDLLPLTIVRIGSRLVTKLEDDIGIRTVSKLPLLLPLLLLLLLLALLLLLLISSLLLQLLPLARAINAR
jgi:hypothetical protein